MSGQWSDLKARLWFYKALGTDNETTGNFLLLRKKLGNVFNVDSIITNREGFGLIIYLYCFTAYMDLLDFSNTFKVLYGFDLKHSSFWPSADVTYMSNELVHAMPGQCMYALHMCILWSL